MNETNSKLIDLACHFVINGWPFFSSCPTSRLDLGVVDRERMMMLPLLILSFVSIEVALLAFEMKMSIEERNRQDHTESHVSPL